MALTKTKSVIVASASSSSGAAARGTLDVRTKDGGVITMKITNGNPAPTSACVARVLISHETGATPTAASAGADWKTAWQFNGGTANNAVTEQVFEFGPGTQHIEVEFTGHNAAVTVEAEATTYSYS